MLNCLALATNTRAHAPFFKHTCNLLSMFVPAQCVLDAYIYHFQPTLWRHFR